ncbi:MAG: PKD-like domain-containing protein, partial [Paludibacter sp.]|nr:PKD-like domain-containing protein [Paludibacter sp.]
PLTVGYTGGVGTATYQWYSNTINANAGGTLISGATTSAYTPGVFNSVGTFYYYVTITLSGNGCGNTTSSTAQVIVVPDPIVSVQPLVTQSLCENSTPTTLSVTVTDGVGTFYYQWYRNSVNNKTTGTLIPGAVSSSFIPSTTAVGTLYYYCVITQSGLGCGVTSATAEVVVNTAPTFTTQPASSSVCQGGVPTLLTVGFTNGTGTPAYQWYSNITNSNTGGTLITGATSSTYSPPSNNAGTLYYYCVLTFSTGGCPNITSNTAYVTVNYYPVINALFEEICSSTTFNVLPKNGNGNIVPANIFYTWSMPIINPIGAITGGSAQLIPQNSISQLLVNITPTPATATYLVTPSANGCPGTSFTVTVTVNPKPGVLFSEPDQTVCSGSNTKAINLSSTTPGNITYNWSATVTAGVTGTIITGNSSTIPVQNLVNTTASPQKVVYSVYTTINNTISCQGMPQYYNITVNPQILTSGILSNYSGYNVSFAGGNNGAIDVSVSGGSGIYTYQWSGPNGFAAITQDISNVYAGSYSLTINDGLCDPVILNFILTEPLPMVIQEDLSAHADVLCFGDLTGVIKVQITQESVGPFNYSISLVGGGIIQSVSNLTVTSYLFTGLAAGSYIVSVTDKYGSIKTLSIVISQPSNALNIVNATVSNFNGFGISCFGANNGSIALQISGGTSPYTYQWVSVNGFNSTSKDISNLAPGNYFMSIADLAGCTITSNYTITEPTDITLVTDLKKDISCYGANDGQISITASGGTGKFLFTWKKNNAVFSNSEDLQNIGAGEYLLSVTDVNGCGPKTAIFTITEPESLKIILSEKTDNLCYGASNGKLKVTVSGGSLMEITPGVFDYKYSWTGTNGFSSTSKNIENLKSGNYTLSVTDKSGCTTTFSALVNQPSEIKIDTVTTPITCYDTNDASISLKISGGTEPYQVSWSNMATGISQQNLSAGVYNIIVTDANYCTKTISVKISEPPVFTINPVIKQISCNGSNDGSIKLNITGGQGKVTLKWSDNSTSGFERNNIGSGIYTVTISDDKPCVITRTFIIQEPRQLTLTSKITNAFDCENTNSGAIDLEVTGGTPPYRYKWSNNTITEDLIAVPPGNYFVHVTDFNNCTSSAQCEVTRQLPIAISVETKPDFNCLSHEIKMRSTAKVTGGIPPYDIKWSGGKISGVNNEIMETTENGTSVLLVTDALGCSNTHSFKTNIPIIGIDYKVFDCNNRIYHFDFLTFGNLFSDLKYLWNFGDGKSSTIKNPMHTYTKPGKYSLKAHITSAECTTTFERIVYVDSIPILRLNKEPKLCKNDSVTIKVSGASNYRWSNGSTTDSLVIKREGSYFVTGITKDGCTSTLNFTATLYPNMNYSIYTNKEIITPQDATVNFWSENILLSKYLWDFGDESSAYGNYLNHNYDVNRGGYFDVKLKVTNPYGCIEEVKKKIWLSVNTLPNTFAPNMNGENIVFMNGWNLQVYNSNGILMYEGINGWDGTYKGKPVTSDTYYYIIVMHTSEGAKSKAGFVTVVR